MKTRELKLDDQNRVKLKPTFCMLFSIVYAPTFKKGATHYTKQIFENVACEHVDVS
jgi:hypothetical protein